MLRQVAGIGFRTSEAKGELIQSSIVSLHHVLELQSRRTDVVFVEWACLHPNVLLVGRPRHRLHITGCACPKPFRPLPLPTPFKHPHSHPRHYPLSLPTP